MEEEKVGTLYRSSRSRSNTPAVGEQNSQQGVNSSKHTISSNVTLRRRSDRQKSKLVTIIESKQEVTKNRVINNKIQDDDSDSSLDLEDSPETKRNRQEFHRKVKRQLVWNGESPNNKSDNRSVKHKGSPQKQDQQKTSDYSSEEFEPGLAYQIYKKAGDWWNKFPKTDYTYSPTSEYRKEVAPGVYPMPNMSRRPLHPTFIKTTPELKKYAARKSLDLHTEQSCFKDSRTLGMHTTKRVEHDWDAVDSDADEIATSYTAVNTSQTTKTWSVISTVKSVFMYIYTFISTMYTQALSYTSRMVSQSDDDLLQGTPERDMPSSANWLERLMTWLYLTLCSILSLDLWTLSRFHRTQTEAYQMSSRHEQVSHFSGERLDESTFGKRKYWRLVLLLLPILFVFGFLLGPIHTLPFPEINLDVRPSLLNFSLFHQLITELMHTSVPEPEPVA